MDVRAQISMVFHLDKCIGCHTCSVSCKNIWTDRKGTEYMWWNNVETKPGTGYPTLWEDQNQYRGGWEISNGQPRLRATGRLRGLTNIFFNPYMANLDDYYEPWTYRYNDLFNSPAGEDQPTARPISKITGKELQIEAGPNWDDDLGGSNIYAANDPNVKLLSDAEKQELFELERMFYFYVPRICNHCLNPGCVAACPSGAAYKRGEDGIVLINQDKCRGWRFCVSGCPYKKAYYNWNTGKSEKCILCFPRIEAGKPPACFHSCPGRIRFLGVILYDADRIVDTVSVPDDKLVDAQRDIILDPFDEKVVEAAMANGISDDVIDAARRSPVYKFVKEWSLALPLHSEFRTIPNLFYVPPLLPAMASTVGGPYKQAAADYFGSVESSRVPVRYLAGLLSAGNEEIVTNVLKKLIAIRSFMRFDSVGDIEGELVNGMLADAGLTPEAAREIVKLSALAGIRERYVVPPSHREMNIEELMGKPLPEAERYSGRAGFGAIKPPKRGL